MIYRFDGRGLVVAIALLGSTPISTPVLAQASAVHREQLEEQAYPAPGYHSVTVKTTVDAGGTVLPHTHPGVEMSYILEGQGVLKMQGQTDRVLKIGDSFSIPVAVVHSLSNTGQGAMTIITTYVLEKNKPLATPVP
jgi:quercetin dioxygenase-like cupin family protein